MSNRNNLMVTSLARTEYFFALNIFGINRSITVFNFECYLKRSVKVVLHGDQRSMPGNIVKINFQKINK
jgi:hypothetical protein